MRHHHPNPPLSLNTSSDQRAQNAQYYLRVLHEMIDLSLDLARIVHRQGQSRANGAQLTPAFGVIARSIRYNIALARTLSDGEQGRTCDDARPTPSASHQLSELLKERAARAARRAAAEPADHDEAEKRDGANYH